MGKGANFSSPLRVDGVTVVDEGGNITGPISATAGSIGSTELATDAVETAKIKNGSVTLPKLATILQPSHVVKYAGEFTWSGSGASMAVTVPGVLLTDIVIASIKTAPAEAAYLVSAGATTDTVTITLSAANTSNDAVIDCIVLRPVA